jgi:hypothetical protein
MTNWKWYGDAGHHCLSHKCRFHLTTEVGNYLISTIGQCFSHDEVPIEIGSGRLYETAVFEISSRCVCGCNLPRHNGSDIEMIGSDNPEQANKLHLEMCQKYSEKNHD